MESGWLSDVDIPQLVSTVVLILVTVGLWKATRSLAHTSRKAREDHKRPNVVVKLQLEEKHRDVMNLVLCNVGLGAALRVSFQLQGDRFDLDGHDIKLRGTSAPIGFLSSGETDTFPLGQTRAIISEDGKSPLQPFSVICEYEDIDGVGYAKEYRLDVRQFKGLRWVSQSMVYRQVVALEKIAKRLSS